MNIDRKNRIINGYKNLSILNDDTEFDGELHYLNPIQIKGKFKGKIITSSILIVSEHAYVEGNIESDGMVIAGTVKGEVFAKQNVEILPSGKVYGNITTKKLKIADGVLFDGTCKMIE